MKYLIISFKSRNELYGFASILKSFGIYSTIINSPKSIGSSCMLSIKLDFKYLNQTMDMLNKKRPKSFLGLYVITQINGNQIVRVM